MTHTQLSQLVQDVINGVEDSSKALDLVWEIKYGNPFAEKCFQEILKVSNAEKFKFADENLKKWNMLNSHTPKMKKAERESQFKRVGFSNIKPEPHWVKDSQRQYGY